MARVMQPSVSDARQDLYRRMDKDNLAPLWEVLHALVPREPQGPCRAALSARAKRCAACWCWKTPACAAALRSPPACTAACS
jgi:hypothetical protein